MIGEGERNRSLALHWVFDDPAALNLNLMALETAPDVSTALAQAPGFGLPTQNLLVADQSGAIGWTVAGRLPRRVGYDGRLPALWAYGDRRWDGNLPPEEYPRIISPASGQLWSANNRPVSGADYDKLGDGGYAAAARAHQIRDDLTAITTPATPRALLAVQLDDRARFLERWQQLLLATLTPEAVAAKKTGPRCAVLSNNGTVTPPSTLSPTNSCAAGGISWPTAPSGRSANRARRFMRRSISAPSTTRSRSGGSCRNGRPICSPPNT